MRETTIVLPENRESQLMNPDTDHLLRDLNPPQRQAVTHGNGPLLVLAGAGSGKTRVIIYRIAWLLAQGIPPRQVLAVTFTNKAAGAMKHRVAELVGPEAANLWVSTFHSFCARFLRMEHEAALLPREFSIYDEDDSRRLLKRVIEHLQLPVRTFTPGVASSRISAAKDRLQDPAALANLAKDEFERRIAEIYSVYQEELAKAGAVDFDDLILRAVQTLTDSEIVRQRWQEQFEHVLVDEYQDTNTAQARLVDLLCEPQRNVCVVGDDDQSIYAWRGANIKNILQFERRYPGTTIIRLEQNYRSRPNILEAAHAVVAANLSRHPKKLWTDKHAGEPITLIMSPDDWVEADMVLGRIRLLCQRDDHVGSDFVILYRTNAQSRAFEEACRRQSIPYVLVGGVRFYQRAEIKDVLAYAQLTVNPNDSVALFRVINRPKRGIGEAAQEKLIAAQRADGRRWSEFLSDPTAITAAVGPRTANAVTAFWKLRNELTEIRGHLALAEWCRHLVEIVNLKAVWEEDDPLIAQSRQENVDELVAAMAEYEAMSDAPSLSGFLEQAALVSDIDNYESKQDAVTLMTIHSAKGLEFPVVFITGLEEGLFPLSRAMEKLETLEEERRLFYVAATRAKERLFLTYARTRHRFGPVASMKSRFIEEIPREYLDVENLIPEIELEPGNLGYDAPGRSWRTGFQTPTRRARAVRRTDADSDLPRSGLAHALQAGTIIRHPQFGEGEVLAIRGSGDGTVCDVAFRAGFTKTLMVRFAPLEVLRG